MRLLLDNNLSPRLVAVLVGVGWDVVHVGKLGLQVARDEVVLQAARDDDRILISADTDFGALLAASRAAAPSVVLVRRIIGRRVEDLAALLIANLPVVEFGPPRGEHRGQRG
jgi:predicted nuclease of predicted toxin-antitoxin system